MRELLDCRPIYVFTDVMNGKRRVGLVRHINTHTTWVRIMLGAKTFMEIKRHNIKHHLSHYKLGEYYEPIRTEVGDEDSPD
jgi:hypothetical protein